MYTKEQIELADQELDMLTVEIIAAACHQQNKTYCTVMDDGSQVPWLEAPEWQTSSAVNGVKAALTNPNPAASHESWLAQKEEEGWVHGETKDVEAKTHPCMMPYSDLPEAQKRKDHFFIEMAQQLGLVAGLIRVLD
jgi:hypothetical protein